MCEYIVSMPSDMPYEIKAELNAWYVNSEPIVRCRDCVWFCEANELFATDDWCRNFGCEVEPDGFCAWAKRRGDAE